MKKYKDTITLIKNNRGCYILDTVKGCGKVVSCPSGCYGECYAANIAKRYKFAFGTPVKRNFLYNKKQLYFNGFYDTKHESDIIKRINKINMPFVRIGEMGDPSEFWEHTLNICDVIKQANKKIVIVTKHWKIIPEYLLDKLDGMIVNTSISAMDSKSEIKHRLNQYNRLKKHCTSILRIVTCDFNLNDENGFKMNKIQNELLKNENVIETIFRLSTGNDLLENGVINAEKKHFLKNSVLVSCRDKNVFFGKCQDCKEMCGIGFVGGPIK